ncbi:hypothetical protein LX59_02061 [Azomonas agilis]|uniref:Uncharacterized protein n=1 Tax=Azomonas agilis TaxID=116849 RepID=A0A562I212_9GAMM|nr:YkgJ family cysteine cluster protein [Azomonas agilis]TWH64715.1 hypothetical protein LX59_02061 [Azomonas agilis]
MDCRPGCAACCIAPSISSPIPEMPLGKPANQRCIQLDEHNLCLLFGKPERPAVCLAFQADETLCQASSEQALKLLSWLEEATA